MAPLSFSPPSSTLALSTLALSTLAIVVDEGAGVDEGLLQHPCLLWHPRLLRERRILNDALENRYDCILPYSRNVTLLKKRSLKRREKKMNWM